MGAQDDAARQTARDAEFARIEQWATEIVRTVIHAPSEQHAALQVMRLLSDIQTQISAETLDEIGRRLHAVPTTSRPARRGERQP